MTEATKQKFNKAYLETAEALHAFRALSDPITVSQIAVIRRILCGVTTKLVSVESELALSEERQRA